MEGDGVSDLVRRKVEHIDLVLAGVGRGAISAGFEHLQFEHSALPDLDFDAVDLTTHFLGRPLRAPLIISSMTGGPSRSGMINDRLAQAAQALGIGFAVVKGQGGVGRVRHGPIPCGPAVGPRRARNS